MKGEPKAYNEIATNWQTLRSQLYLHHRGICWICHELIELQDYEVGHLVDRCNGGQDVIENLAPMHKWCNNSKPRHNTLEEHITWLLKTRWQAQKPAPSFPNMPSLVKHYAYRKNGNNKSYRGKSQLSMIDLEANKALSQPSSALQNTSDAIKLEVVKLLGRILDTPTQDKQPKSRSILQPQPITRNNHKRIIRPAKISQPKPITEEQLAKIKPATVCWIQGRPLGRAMWKVLPPPYKQENLFTIRTTPPGATDNGGHNIQETLQVIGGDLMQEINIDLGHTHIHITPNGDKPSITLSPSKQSNNSTARNRTVGMGKGQIPLEEWYKAKAEGITFKDFVDTYPQG